MPYLQETAEFTEGIYRIELTDYAEGGEEGLSNRQAKALANRTRFLKNKVQDLEEQIQDLEEQIQGIETGGTTDSSLLLLLTNLNILTAMSFFNYQFNSMTKVTS